MDKNNHTSRILLVGFIQLSQGRALQQCISVYGMLSLMHGYVCESANTGAQEAVSVRAAPSNFATLKNTFY